MVQALGQWVGLISSNGNTNISCSTMTFGPLSQRSFTMNSTFYETGTEPYSLVFNCTLANDSNVIVCDKGAEGEMVALITDILYDSHMVMYTTSTVEKVGSGNDGYLFLLGRGNEISNEIFEKVKKSKFYLDGLKPDIDLHTKRTDGCP